MKAIKLGKRYRDSVSGWEGVATARYEYLNGCVRIELGDHDKDGEPKAFVFDESQIVDAETAEKLTGFTGTGGRISSSEPKLTTWPT